MKQNAVAPVLRSETLGAVRAAVLQRKCACGQHTSGGECEECKKKNEGSAAGYGSLQRKASSAESTPAVPSIVHEVLRSPGQPLDTATRSFFEPRFGYDFSRVRIHTDAHAAESARAVSASAYTVGNRIVFGHAQYSPADTKGRGLLAHELTHVVQQRNADWPHGAQLQVGSSESALEASAEKNATSVEAGRSLDTAGTPQQGTIQRDDPPIDKEKADVIPKVQLDPNIIELGLDITKGRHKIDVSGSLSQPLNLLGVNVPGLDPSQFIASLQYDNQCNGAVQSALVQLQQDQRQGGRVFDFKRNQWRVGTRLGFRSGSVLFEPGGTIAFQGNQFDSLVFTFTITTGVDATIPTKCIPTPTPAKPTPANPGGDKPDKPKDTGGRVPDKPAEDPPKGGGEIKPPSALTLYFFYDTSVLRPESNHALELLKASLVAFASLRIVLLGHTSLEGTDAYNMKLSQSRADTVRTALVLAGIDGLRIQTIPMGESAPAVIEPPQPRHTIGDKLEKLRDMNRRVEVVFFDPTGKFGPTSPELKLSVPEKVKPGSTR